jgi:hypothetical protein
MYNQHQPHTPLTYERLMTSLYESGAEFDRRMKESDLKRQEDERLFKEEIAENKRLRKESDDRFEKSKKEYEERMAKYEDDYRKHQKKMARIDETFGSWGNNFGSFAEEYFFNAFDEEKQDFFGEHFNEIEKNVKPVVQNHRKEYLKDEYDIVMYNDSYVAIVETKFKAHKSDIPKVLKKAETFRILCPDFKDFKIYLGLASMCFYPELEQECIEHGIAIIKQVGDIVVISDAHLKVY